VIFSLVQQPVIKIDIKIVFIYYDVNSFTDINLAYFRNEQGHHNYIMQVNVRTHLFFLVFV